MTDKEKAAWWRGKKISQAGQSLNSYKRALESYSESERNAFLSGYAGQPIAEKRKGQPA